MYDQNPNNAKPRFVLKEPYSTFLPNGNPPQIPYVIDGLLTQGGFSILAAKSKQGKSSLARSAVVAIAKGTQFLGRAATQGECLIFNLEDPLLHFDNCLKVLRYDESTDAKIHIVSKLFQSLDENIEALSGALTEYPGLRLVVIDHLHKFIRRTGGVEDMNDTGEVSKALEKLTTLARAFPHVHILCVAHCKKVQPDDPFDGVLGSQSFRAETDTNIVIYERDGEKLIAAETRMGRRLAPTLLESDLIDSAGEEVVANFRLGLTAEQQEVNRATKKTAATQKDRKGSIVDYLKSCDEFTATQEAILEHIKGNRQFAIGMIKELATDGALTTVSEKPLTYSLDSSVWGLLSMGDGAGIKKETYGHIT